MEIPNKETLAVGFILVYLSYYLFWKYLFREKKPPGPWCLPLIGHGYILFHKMTERLSTARKKYGPIANFEIPLFGMNGVLINDFNLLKEVFNDPVYQGRPDQKFFSHIFNGKKGIVTSDGDTWAEQRRFTLRHLRDFGFGKRSMDTMIQPELEDLLNNLKKDCGTPIDLKNRFNLSILNSIWYIISGTRYSLDDPELVDLFNQINGVFTKPPISIFIPWIKKLLPWSSSQNNYTKMVDSLNAFYLKAIVQHKKDFVPGQEPKDFIEAYLNEIRKTTDEKSSFYGAEGESQLLSVIGNLFFAGTESTSNTLCWTLLYMMLNPQVQSKIHEEIDQVIGKDRLPSLEDKESLPYTEAVILEVLRKSSIIVLGITHTTMKDTTLLGYPLKKGASVGPNIYGIQNDPDFWGDPEIFRPERFLPHDQTRHLKERVIAFSIGKRVCIAENIAKDMLLMFLIGILQKFQVTQDPNAKSKPTDMPLLAVNLIPRPFKVILTER